MTDKVSDEIKQKWDYRIKFCREHRELLNDWEEDFTISVEEQRYFGKILKPGTIEKLYEIYHKVEEKL